ncbi:MAG: hypothetical protein ACLTXZ_07340, partial [Oscillospiraceae bacterium]
AKKCLAQRKNPSLPVTSLVFRYTLVYRLFPHRARGNIPEQGLYRGLVAKKRAAWYNICCKFGTDERKRS